MNGIEKCYAAFERLKTGKPNNPDLANIEQDKITSSIVSQEAGFTGGYLKNEREQHQLIISMIALHVKDHAGTTMSKSAAILRQKNKANIAKDKKNAAFEKLEASLGRELQLYHCLKNAESEIGELKFKLAQYSNVTKLPI
jgi:hypothetical protein